MEPTSIGAEPQQPQAPPGASLPEGAEPAIAPEAGAASEPSRGNWLRDAFRRMTGGGGERAADAAAPDEQAEGGQSDRWQPPTFGSKEEFDQYMERHARSYADRRDHARAQRSEQQQVEALNAQVAEAEGRKAVALREHDLYTVGEIEEEIERLKAGPGGQNSLEAVVGELRQQVTGETVARYDTILDRVIERVPPKERAALFPSDADAAQMDLWQQRAYVAEHAVEALMRGADERQRAKLRSDPVFQKEMLAVLRGERLDDEPVLVSAAPVGAGPADMNQFLRSVRTHTRR